MSWIFSKYVARVYSGWLLAMLGAFSFLVLLFDSLELLRRARTRGDVDFSYVLKLALLHLPDLLIQIMPLVVLFATLLMMRRFGRSGQLVAAKAAGSSIWQIMAPIFGVITLYSGLYFTVLNPLGAALTERYEKEFQRLFKGGGPLVTLAGSGLWVRQEMTSGYALVKLGHIRSALRQADQVTIYLFGPDNIFRERIDAAHAHVGDETWDMTNVLVSHPRSVPEKWAHMSWRTPLPFSSVENQFFSPNVISLWSLPSFIEMLNQAGVSSLRHRLYWNTTMASPLLLFAMALLGTIGAWRSMQRRETFLLPALAMATAFGLYVFQTMLLSLGHSHTLPVVLAGWTPATVGILLTWFWLLQLEEE